MKYVLLYKNGALSKAKEHFAAHQALWTEYQKAGTMLMVGPFVLPAELGAMSIFTTRAAAEAFVKADPFVTHGVVASWSLLEWKEAITG